MASLAGSVVHLVLQTITKAMTRAGATSLDDASAVDVMRRLGGYTNVIKDCIVRVLNRFGGNPRTEPLLGMALRLLNSRIPEMRVKAQTLLGRVRLRVGEPGEVCGAPTKARPEKPLGPGTYPELELKVPTIGWRGTADLLILSSERCEIIDFKTGQPDESHKFQLKVYALLWSRDSDLNPSGRLIDRLTVSYQSGEEEIDPPTVAELQSLENDLVVRRNAAIAALSEKPPQARPSIDNCRYCSVRHLCDEYWEQPTTISELGDSQFTDLQITIVARHGPSSWDGFIHQPGTASPGRKILLRTTGPEVEFAKNDRIRVLDVNVSAAPDPENAPLVLTMHSTSEAFIL
jgi:hypothetical protein